MHLNADRSLELFWPKSFISFIGFRHKPATLNHWVYHLQGRTWSLTDTSHADRVKMPPEMWKEMAEHKSDQEGGLAISSTAILCYSAPSGEEERFWTKLRYIYSRYINLHESLMGFVNPCLQICGPWIAGCKTKLKPGVQNFLPQWLGEETNGISQNHRLDEGGRNL